MNNGLLQKIVSKYRKFLIFAGNYLIKMEDIIVIDPKTVLQRVDQGYYERMYNAKMPNDVLMVAQNLQKDLNNNTVKLIASLEKLITKYPLLPFTKQWLAMAYATKGDEKKYLEILDDMARKHPKFIQSITHSFSKAMTNYDFEKALKVLGGKPLSLNNIFPKTKQFAKEDIIGYGVCAIQYLVQAEQKIKPAKQLFETLKEIEPNHEHWQQISQLVNMKWYQIIGLKIYNKLQKYSKK